MNIKTFWTIRILCLALLASCKKTPSNRVSPSASSVVSTVQKENLPPIGKVLKHIPKDMCSEGIVFFNIAGLANNAAMQNLFGSLEAKVLVSLIGTSNASSKGEAPLEVLKKSGLDPKRDLYEIALCGVGSWEQIVIAIHGNFFDKEALLAFAKASADADNSTFIKKQIHQLSYIEIVEKKSNKDAGFSASLDASSDTASSARNVPNFIMQLTPDTLVFSENLSVVSSLSPTSSTNPQTYDAHTLFAADGVLYNHPSEGTYKVRILEKEAMIQASMSLVRQGDEGEALKKDPEGEKQKYIRALEKLTQKLASGPAQKLIPYLQKTNISTRENIMTFELFIPANTLAEIIQEILTSQSDFNFDQLLPGE